MKNNLKITIITVCLNRYHYINNCIESVLSQSYNNIEYIIIDGDSQDGTKDIIKKYDENIDRWISEKDSGISEAMNKGLSFSSGDYILFLHSDDYLLSNNSIEDAVYMIDKYSDIYAFSVVYGNKTKHIKKNSMDFSYKILFKTPIMHQGAFCKNTVFDKIGNFDTSLKIAMDYDFFLRAYLAGCTIKCIGYSLCFMRDIGLSSKKNWDSLKARFYEEKTIHYKNNKNRKMHYIYKIYWPVYLIYRYIRTIFLKPFMSLNYVCSMTKKEKND